MNMRAAGDAAPIEPVAGPRVPGAGGVEIATWYLGGEGPPLMMVHATGLHGRGWAPLAPALSEKFSVWAMDQRGHGLSGKAPDGRYDDWSLFAGDLLAVLDALDGHDAGVQQAWRGVGHSLGGGVLVLAELARPGTFASLALWEPIVPPPGWLQPEGAGTTPVQNPMSDLARRRRRRFASRQAARANYASKPPFSLLAPSALDAYVEWGFVDSPRGGVDLCCAPEDEASVYEGAMKHGAWNRLGEVRCPVLIAAGSTSTGGPPSAWMEELAGRLPRGRARRFDSLGHFGPFEDPTGVGAALAVELA